MCSSFQERQQEQHTAQWHLTKIANPNTMCENSQRTKKRRNQMKEPTMCTNDAKKTRKPSPSSTPVRLRDMRVMHDNQVEHQDEAARGLGLLLKPHLGLLYGKLGGIVHKCVLLQLGGRPIAPRKNECARERICPEAGYQGGQKQIKWQDGPQHEVE